MTELTVSALAEMVQGRLIGDGTRVIRGIGDLRQAQPDRVGFVRDERWADAAKGTQAGALLTAAELETDAVQILVADVDYAFLVIASHFHPKPQAVEHMVHGSAVVHPEAVLEEPVQIGANAVVGRAKIGAGTVVMANATIGDDVTLGRDCVLYPQVTIYDQVTIGDRFVAHGGCVIGSDGFGYKPEGGKWHKVPQLGGVRIGDDVELGASTVIDRGAVNDTVIHEGCKLDNLCHIAHNVELGRHTIMAAGAMVAGSTKVGEYNIWGGQAACAGHLTIAPHVHLGGGTSLLRSIREPGEYIGYPPIEKKAWVRLQKQIVDFPAMRADWKKAQEEQE
ncbi:MAG: UDP-3-O-(3-hydroxymyristoyl)glucosamine N-acyltransferase [bacterium]|nr:UDP-3-O-(3-hydroxymyristoyl)glucosamine N-acyltransferase [bacterium]